jgi:predicted nucleic acid-binding protein
LTSLVLDASAAVRLILGHPDLDESWIDIVGSAERVLVPSLYFSEVANALWKYVRADVLTEEEALLRLREGMDLASESADDSELVGEAFSTAARFHHPVYDALYAVLARRHGCPVLTADARLQALLTELRLDFL